MDEHTNMSGNISDDQVNTSSEQERERKLSPVQVILSVLAAAIGVQSDKNRQRDFEKGNPLVFIAAGLIFTLLFIITLLVVVNWVLGSQ